MIQITVLFFGALKNHFGSQLEMEITSNSTLGDVVTRLCQKQPDAAAVVEQCQLAVNAAIEGYDFKITQNCEIAVLPPFSGG